MTNSGLRRMRWDQSSEDQALGGEERAILFPAAGDGQVVHFNHATRDEDPERPDADGAIDLAGGLPLGERAHRRPKVDRERAHDRDRQNGRRHGRRDSDVPKRPVV